VLAGWWAYCNPLEVGPAAYKHNRNFRLPPELRGRSEEVTVKQLRDPDFLWRPKLPGSYLSGANLFGVSYAAVRLKQLGYFGDLGFVGWVWVDPLNLASDC
jgi:hypothetical protein